MRPLFRLIRAVILTIVPAIGVSLAGTWFLLGTETGHAWLGQEIARLLSAPGRKVSIAGFEGALPFHPRIASLELADDSGTWLSARALAIDVSPRALLDRRLEIDRIEVGEASILRKPIAGAASGPISFSMPSLPFAVLLRQLRVPRLSLAPPVLGQAVALGLAADGALARGRLVLTAALDRLDGHPGQARVSLTYGDTQGAPDHLDVAMTATDPSGLVVKALDPDAGPLPLDLSIHGDGPLGSWRGTLMATAGNEARLRGTVALDRDATGLSIDVDSNATLGALLPTRLRPVIGKDMALAVLLRVPDRGPVAITRLAARTTAGTVALHGDFGIPTGELNLSLQGEIALAPFSGLAGQTLDGHATIDAAIAGPKAAPRLSMRLVTRGLLVAGARIDKSDTEITIAGRGADTAHGFVSGEISGVTSPSGALPRLLMDDLLWSAEITAGSGDALLDIRRARIDDSVLHADLSGQYGRGGGRATVRITADDLSPFAPPSAPAIAGRAVATTGIVLRPDGDLRAEARASATSIRFGIPALDALIGGRLDLAATLERAKGGAVTVSAITAIAAQARASGKAKFDSGGTHLVADGRLTLPQLASLSGVLGGPISGSAVMTGSASGSLRAPLFLANLETTGLRLRERPIDRLQMTAKTSPLQPKALDLRLDLGASGLSESATTTLSWGDLPRIELGNLVLAGTAAQGSGSFGYDTVNHRASGHLQGGIADLAEWSSALDTELSGQAELALTATAAEGQGLSGKLHLRDLGIGPRNARSRLQDASIDMTMTGLFTRPQGRVAAHVSDGRAGAFSLASAHFEATRSTGQAIQVTMGLSGAFREPVSFEAAGSISDLDHDAHLALASLDGRLGSQPIHLRRTLNLTRRGDSIAIVGMDLALGGGGVTASGDIDRSRGRITLAARDIDLEPLARLFGQDEISGALGATGAVSGPWARPDGQFTVTVPALKLAAASHPELPPLAAKFAMTLRNEALAINGRVETLGHESIAVTGGLPLKITPGGPRLFTSLGSIRLVVAGEGRLEDVAAILPLGEDQIGGSFTIDLSVGGTMDQPQAAGGVTVSQGHYDNLATGVSLRNLNLELVGNQSALELRRLDANDAEDGHISGSGRVSLSGTSGPGLDLALIMTKFVVTRLDTATVTASGNATVTGSLSTPRISGQFGIDRADIQIPDKLPSQIPTVAVIRINSLHPRQETPPPVLPSVVAGLDVTITAPGKIFISGQGLTSEWQGKVSATGTSDAPNLVGRFTSIRGTYAVLGKTFTLQRGVIGFAGGGTVDPILDIQAERIATDITARIMIAGTASAPGLTLTSTPALPQDEILSRVLFGTGVGQISTIQALQLAQTAAAFTGNAPDVMSKVRGIVGLDQLTLDSDPTSKTPATKTGFGNTTINGGKYIAPGVFVGVQKGLTPSATKGQVQITISPHVSFEGAIGAGSSSSSVGLAYRRDY